MSHQTPKILKLGYTRVQCDIVIHHEKDLHNMVNNFFGFGKVMNILDFSPTHPPIQESMKMAKYSLFILYIQFIN